MFKTLIRNGAVLLSRKQTNILSAAFIIMLAYASSMLLGLLRERLLVDRFFACCRPSLDTYYAAFRLPDMVFQLVAIGALSAAFIPVFSHYVEKEDKRLAYRFSSTVINYLVIFFVVLSAIIFILARPLAELITGSFTPLQIDLMAKMIRVMLFAQILFLLSNFLSAIIQVNQRFLIPALAPVFYNLGIIFSILLLANPFGIWAPVIGVLIGALLHLGIQIPLAIRLGFSYSLVLDRKIAGVGEVYRLMIPRALALAVYQIDATVAVFLATSLSSGSLTMFYLAQRLIDLPVRLFGTPIGQAALPTLACQTTNKKLDEFKKTLIATLNQILYLALPAMALILVLRVPLVRLAYGTKTFPWQATLLTARAVGLLSLAIFSQAIIQVLVRGYYALRDTKTPFFIGSFSVVLNISLSIALTFGSGWGILGLAVATAITSLIQASLLLFFLERKLLQIVSVPLIRSWGKMAQAVTLTAIFLWLPMRVLDRLVLDTSRTINLVALTIVATLVGTLVYIGFSLLLKIPEVFIFERLIRRLGQWQSVLKESEEILTPGSDHKEGGLAR